MKFSCLMILILFVALPADAQTCLAPTVISSATSFSGNTCSNTIQLPFLANGAIAINDSQDIFRLTATHANSLQLSLQPEAGLDMSLFVCRNQCSTYATCLAAVDSGRAGAPETASIPDWPGDYFIVVSASNGTSPACGSYVLTVSAPTGFD